jgi:hypothetical protein
MAEQSFEPCPSISMAYRYPEHWLFLLFDAPRFYIFNRTGTRGTILVLVLLTWAPLAVLTLIEGGAGRSGQSFFRDISIYTNFFFTIPLLVLSSAMLRRRFTRLVHHFEAANIIKPEALGSFRSFITSLVNVRHAIAAEVILLALTVSITALFIAYDFPPLSTGWRTTDKAAELQLSWAGWWFVLVSRSIYFYFLLHFLYGVILWWIFLGRMSRTDLQLQAVHPDRMGGLGFLGTSLVFLSLPALAISAGVAGAIADLAVSAGVSVFSYKYLILITVGLLALLFIFPLLFFIPQLVLLKQDEFLKYNELSSRELEPFEKKWVPDGHPGDDILSTADFQRVKGFTDLVDNIYDMHILIFTPRQATLFFVVTLMPFVLVLALEIPVRQMLNRLFAIFF